MAQTLKFGNKVWAAKEDSVLAYNDINNNYKPLPFTFSRASIGTRVNKDGLIETMGQDIARIDYTDSADGVLLLEPASTNLLNYSEQIQNTTYWNDLGGDLVVTGNAIISPDGTLNAGAITLANSSNRYFVHSLITLTVGGSYTFSVYMKSAIGNLSVGIGGVNGIVVENKTVTTEWQRFTYTFTVAAGAVDYFGIDQRGLDKSTSGTLYFWGAQVEQLSYPTSYIPTSGSTVTRAAETCNNSGNSEVFNDSEGVLFVNTATLQEGVTEKIISLSDGTTSNNIYFSFSGAANTIFGLVVSGGSTQASLSTTVSQIQPNKLLIKYKSNDISFWLNGFKVGFDTSANAPSGLKNLSFSYPTNAINFYGKTKELGYYNTALTDAELETLTSYRNWVSMVNELNLNIIYNG